MSAAGKYADMAACDRCARERFYGNLMNLPDGRTVCQDVDGCNAATTETLRQAFDKAAQREQQKSEGGERP